MNETLKRALSGAIYVAIMLFGTTYSTISFHSLFILILIVSIFEMWKLRKGKTKFLPFLYILFPLTLIHNINYNTVLYLFILTWSFDTFAYLFGVKFGKHRIMENISPKKSWEGFAGGFVSTIIVSYISINYFELFNSISNPLIISLFLPFTATLGDFIESHYKRGAGVKDSGKFIPGHGGMLDRIDAFMITIPIIYLIIKFL